MTELDTEKVRFAFEQIKDDNDKLAEFAKDIIPRLIDDLDSARLYFVKALLGDLPTKNNS